ncbi:tetratricopeptide repeat protein [Saccharicrinis fermentans]|uniref:Outer membrane protein PgaA n=1 Tax=Saccharicrinis fermentans DSM 9555 = JCM 21142 TaxID=869213 RepID=W7Y1V6_9BACT|nr:tetratricopeptide repeat protein [Saccharicrinis fermentans]GAF01508.1 outer membrane protein PgaA [Saccharicrinis fermentans DSM 9555 = JCM 21142]
MNAKLIITILLCMWLAPSLAGAQNSDFETIVSRGMTDYHNGKYENALSWYKQAYQMNRNSELVCYQIAATYLTLQDYESAAIYSSKLLKKDGEYSKDAYLINASAWENLGRTKKARKIYREALKKHPSNYLLHYNLALSCFNNHQMEEAMEHTISAIEIYPAHASSHLLLAYTMFDMGERVQSMLPLYYFLLLEQDSDRSSTAYDMLESLWNQGVRVKGQRDIQLIKAGFNYGEFANAELAVSMIQPSDFSEDHAKSKVKNKLLNKFVSNSTTLFKVLEESAVDKDGFWWDFYVNFFSKLHRNELDEAFSYYISGCRFNQDVLLWMSENNQEFQEFSSWMEAQ